MLHFVKCYYLSKFVLSICDMNTTTINVAILKLFSYFPTILIKYSSASISIAFGLSSCGINSYAEIGLDPFFLLLFAYIAKALPTACSIRRPKFREPRFARYADHSFISLIGSWSVSSIVRPVAMEISQMSSSSALSSMSFPKH